jgi:hypothetical protein
LQIACQDFLHLTFISIIKKTLESCIFDLISDTVDRHISPIGLNTFHSPEDLQALFDKVHDDLLMKMFLQDSTSTSNSTDNENSFAEEDEEDFEFDQDKE